MDYIRQLGLAVHGEGDVPPSACFLCAAVAGAGDDTSVARRLVLVDDARGLVVLNKYPYTNGHLLAAPREHVESLSDLSAEARAGLMELTALCERLLRAAMNPQGLNVGVNMGRCAGAGLPGHLHVHIVPRWNGDTNFMAVVGQVRVMPQSLEESYDLLAATLRKLEAPQEGRGADGAAPAE